MSWLGLSIVRNERQANNIWIFWPLFTFSIPQNRLQNNTPNTVRLQPYTSFYSHRTHAQTHVPVPEALRRNYNKWGSGNIGHENFYLLGVQRCIVWRKSTEVSEEIIASITKVEIINQTRNQRESGMAYFSTLKIEATFSSETSSFQRPERRYVLKDRTAHSSITTTMMY
jgi:hypothetical protein